MTNDASMTAAVPAACEAMYFSMPSLTGVTYKGRAATATTSPRPTAGPVDFTALTNQGTMTRAGRWERLCSGSWLA
jgi:hypothetical protein